MMKMATGIRHRRGRILTNPEGTSLVMRSPEAIPPSPVACVFVWEHVPKLAQIVLSGNFGPRFAVGPKNFKIPRSSKDLCHLIRSLVHSIPQDRVFRGFGVGS